MTIVFMKRLLRRGLDTLEEFLAHLRVVLRHPQDRGILLDRETLIGDRLQNGAAPSFRGNPANVDPEEAFVAALSGCHMLTFLAIACKQKFVLDSYEDAARRKGY
jgi:hypothetical protein